ncbi:MAG: CarD family transcriptional regulator [Clostridia bacterium]|nr:CarD family transcriptional regulator [Clostridia bacterium]
MFKKDDYVVNKAHGLCQIIDICMPEGINYNCFLIMPVISPTLKIYFPVKNALTHFRKPLNAEQAKESIKKLPFSDIKNITESKTKNNEYKKMLYEGTAENLAALVKVLYGKQIPVKDAMHIGVLKTAETLYLTEIGFALGKTNEDIKKLILEQM